MFGLFPPFLAELPARIVHQNKMPHSKCNLQFVLFFWSYSEFGGAFDLLLSILNNSCELVLG